MKKVAKLGMILAIIISFSTINTVKADAAIYTYYQCGKCGMYFSASKKLIAQAAAQTHANAYRHTVYPTSGYKWC